MSERLLAMEPAVRLALFVGALTLFALWELAAPRLGPSRARLARWPHNIGLIIVGTLLIRVVAPVPPVGLALILAEREAGVLNWLGAPVLVAFVLSLLALDLGVYVQHRLFHAVPFLWRLHRVHHADLTLDVTTGLRFHPLEMLVSLAIKLALVAALGPPAAAVLVFEVTLNATSIFNHADIRLPAPVDRVLRLIIVTPDMHRVHHSSDPAETDRNFGFNLPWWDRLFATYQAQPARGLDRMQVGLAEFRAARDGRLDQLLIQPFLAGHSRADGPR
ncbi:MAG: sterol desaturase family protein [Caulobacterales bacterium]|nr:sterol desaturase family protein [Caulobacterales bacterium]